MKNTRLKRAIAILMSLAIMATLVSGLELFSLNVKADTASVTVGNHGYPYGSGMDSGITFNVDVTVTEASTYQWYVSSDAGATYSEVEGKSGNLAATDTSFSTVFSNSELTEGNWYKCRFNGDATNETTPLMVMTGYSGYYLSNGQMAYTIYGSETDVRFDVIGKYQGNWITRTSYDRYWQLYTSTEAEPDASCVGGNTGGSSTAVLDYIKVYFLQNDYDGSYDTSNDSAPHTMIFETKIAETEHAFCFGSDVMVNGNDYAPCTAVFATNGNLRQIQLVDADSVDVIEDDDPALVVNTSYSVPTKYYVGYWGNRLAFGFGTSSDSNNDSYSEYYTYDALGHVTQVTGTDSGISASYTNLSAGAVVTYAFSMGTVSQTGAVSGNINYSNETLDGLDANSVYEVTVTSGDNTTTYVITTDADGSLALSGTDNNGVTYDLFGKEISVVKQGSSDSPLETEIVGRPSAEEADTSGTDDDDNANSPADVGTDTVISTETTITINIDTDDATKMAQEYRIFDEDGNELEGYGWVTPNQSTGVLSFTGLTSGQTYIVKARIPATQMSPASIPSSGITIRTIGTVNVTVASALTATYDGNPHSFTVTPNPSDALVEYSLDPDEDYGSSDGTITNAGTYTVYYRVTKSGYRTAYGSFEVTIAKAQLDELEPASETLLGTESGTDKSVDISAYLYGTSSLVSYTVTGEIADYITVTGINNGKLVYTLAENTPAGATGNITAVIQSDNYENYTLVIPVLVASREAKVTLNEEGLTGSAVSNVTCNGLSDFVESLSDYDVSVELLVKPVDESNIDATTVADIKEAAKITFTLFSADEINYDFIDMSIIKTITEGASQSESAVADVGNVLEICITYDLTGKYNPVVIREHEGDTLVFARLDSRPTDNFVDGTYYIDGNDTIYIYTRYFSTYTVAYTTASTTASTTAESVSTDVATGDDSVKVWVILLILTLAAGVVISNKNKKAYIEA